jgi:hypothetical protein
MRTSALVANICSVSLAEIFASFNGLVDSMVSCVQLSILALLFLPAYCTASMSKMLIIALSSFGWYHELGIDGVVGT